MNILKQARASWDRMVHNRCAKRFEDGYRWAMQELPQGESAIIDVEEMIEESRDFGHYDDFDRGAEKALNEWREKHEAQ